MGFDKTKSRFEKKTIMEKIKKCKEQGVLTLVQI